MDDPVPFLSAKDFRDWAGLPWDVLSEIFDRVGTIYLLVSAQSVCRQWWRLAHEPRIWRRVHMRDLQCCVDKEDYVSSCRLGCRLFPECNLLNIILAVVDRSAGCLEEFAAADRSAGYLESINVLLQRIAERSTQLKVLDLEYCCNVTEHGLIEACKSFPLLEVLDTSNCSLTEAAIESIGQSCPNLKAFSFNNGRWRGQSNRVALAIAKNMCGLQKLEINRDVFDDDGLIAILDGCSHLEFLYIRNCRNLMMGEKLKYRLDKIKVKYYSSFFAKYIDYDDDYEKYGVFVDFDDDYEMYFGYLRPLPSVLTLTSSSNITSSSRQVHFPGTHRIEE